MHAKYGFFLCRLADLLSFVSSRAFALGSGSSRSVYDTSNPPRSPFIPMCFDDVCGRFYDDGNYNLSCCSSL
jgi:hypothetical protein